MSNGRLRLASSRLMVVLFISAFFSANSMLSVADPALPSEVCAEMGVANCSGLTEESTNAQYVDLNLDGTKELVFVYGGGSCGSNYWVFKLDKKVKWKGLGGWCGCDDGVFKVKKTKHNGYFDIWSCGYSGLFDGKEYVEQRQ